MSSPEKELIEKNAVINFLLKVRCNNINECKIQYLFLAFTLKKKITHTHQGQSRKKKDKTHEKAQESQHGLKKQTVLVIGDSMLNGMLEKGLIKEHKLKVDNNPDSTGEKTIGNLTRFLK